MQWEARIVKWESESYYVEGTSLAEILLQLPPENEIAVAEIYQAANPDL